VYPIKELYLYVVDEGQPGMSYSPVALGSAPLRKERTFYFERKDLTGLGLSTHVV